VSARAKAGLPFNRVAISDETIAPSLVTESKDPNDSEASMTSGDKQHKSNDVIEGMLQWPVSKSQRRMTRDNPSAKVFSTSGQAKQPKPSVSVIRGHTHTHTK